MKRLYFTRAARSAVSPRSSLFFSALLYSGFLLTGASALSGCATTTPGPDKSVSGAVLGAAWGAGAGAIIGHQTGAAGPGAGIGAGFGAVSGMITGIGLDLAEGTELEEQRQLDVLKVQVMENQRLLQDIQTRLDREESKRQLRP